MLARCDSNFKPQLSCTISRKVWPSKSCKSNTYVPWSPVRSSTGRLISPARLEQGVRFIGAASVRNGDRIVVLDSKGNLRVHQAEALTGSGSVEAEGLVLSIGMIQAEAWKGLPS